MSEEEEEEKKYWQVQVGIGVDALERLVVGHECTHAAPR